MTEQDFLTLKQAAKFTGKSERTMRRFVDSVVKVESENAGADRFHILPTAKEKEEGSTDPWKIDIALLRMRFPEAEDQKADANPEASSDTIDRLLSIVEKQAATQAETIENQNTRIDDLTEKLDTANQEIEDLRLKLLPSGQNHKQQDTNSPVSKDTESMGDSGSEEVIEATKKRAAKHWWLRLGTKV